VAHARRLVAGLAALLGLGLAAVGALLAVTLGAEGRATFTVSAAGPVVLGPSVLNRVDGPVTVEASSSAGPVWLGTAVPQDAGDAVGGARHEEVLEVQVPARTLRLATTGDVALADPRPLHVWRVTAEGRLLVRQADAPESVVAYPTTPGPVLLSVTWRQPGWFVESVAVLVTGVVLLAGAGAWWARPGAVGLSGRPVPGPGADAENEDA